MGNRMKKVLGRILGVLLMLLAMGMTVCAVDAGDIKNNRVFQVNSDVELHEEPDTASVVTATLPDGTPVIIKEDAEGGWCMVAYREQEGYVEISSLAILGSQSAPVSTERPDVAEGTTESYNGIVQNNGTAQDSEVQSGKGTIQNNAVRPDDGATQNGAVQPDADGTQKGDAQPDNMVAGNGITVTADERTLDEEFRGIQEENQRAYQEAEAVKRQAKSDRVWGSVIAVLVVTIFAVGIVTTLAGNKGKKRER